MKRILMVVGLLAAVALALPACSNATENRAREVPLRGPQGRAWTQADSAHFKGRVTPETYFTYLNWAGDLSLSPVTPGSDRVSTSQLDGHVWFFLGVGTGGIKQSSSTETVDFYKFAVTNQVGQTVQLKLPQQVFVFYQVPGVTPHAQFNFKTNTLYKKGDGSSIFKSGAGETSGGSGEAPGYIFLNTPIGVLLARYAISVNIWMTPQQFAQLNTPGLNAAQLPGS